MMPLGLLGWSELTPILGEGWLQAGHALHCSAHEEDAAALQAWRSERSEICVGTHAEVVAQADVLALCAPWKQVQKLLRSVETWQGKLLIDATNPLLENLRLEVGHSLSGSEVVAEFARGATVIKAFNALGTEALQRPDFGDFLAETYVCGDHEQGKAVAMDLARELGLAAIDCGGLQRARLLEPLALLRHELAHTDGYGADLVFRLMKRA